MLYRLTELLLFGLAPFLLGMTVLPGAVVADEEILAGEALYRERMALPKNARLSVRLAGVSAVDARSKVIGETLVDPVGQVPIPFRISFDPTLIRDGMSYALQARITVDGELWFVTTGHHPVKPIDAPHQTVMLQRTSAESTAAAVPTGKWVLTSLGGEAPVVESMITLEWDEAGRIAGSGGCNRYSAGVEIADTTLKIGPAVSTRMACEDALMKQEHRFLAALETAGGFKLEKEMLILADETGQELMRFGPLA